MDYNTNGLCIQKFGTAFDGYSGGLQVLRDVSTANGGTPGFVNCANYTYTKVGPSVSQYEWNALFLLDNSAGTGENCAMYAQANAKSTGNTWAGCFEVCEDSVPSKNSQMRALEVDVGASGQDNGQRYGIHLVVSDGPAGRNGTHTQAEATYAIHAGASGSSTYARWMYGIVMRDYKNAGLYLNSSNSIRGIHVEGKHIVSLDLSGSEDATSIRMKAGQRICFDGYDNISLLWANGRMKFCNSNTPILEIDTITGDIYKKGIKVL